MGGTSFPQGRGTSDKPVMAVGTERDGSPVLDSDTCVVITSDGNDSVQLPVAHIGGPPITVIAVPNPDGTPPAAHLHVWPAENGRVQGEGIDESCDVALMVVTVFIPVTDTDWAINTSASGAVDAGAMSRTPEIEADAAAKRVAAKAASAKAKAEKAKADADAEAKARAETEKDEEDAEARHKAKNKRHTAEA
jgi:hypothetical protein